ncbi:undecaprenyl-diphosphatase [Haladaptatus sp. CMAA 1911]|uniref:undecaprenyl-diphosphatase n=1 Tax=unclassified Haladaptatus TaxID=2622732 RepID=UPI00375444F0
MTAFATAGLPMQYGDLFTSHTGTPVLNELMIFAADNLVYLIPLALLALWFMPDEEGTNTAFRMALAFPRVVTKNGKTKSVFIFVTIVVSLALSYAMGQLYSHPAPYMAGYDTLITEAPENSFPSQHTTVVFAFAWAVVYLHDQLRVGLTALLFASFVGISRVYVGVHYPIDIIGGIGASLLGVTIVYAVRDRVTDFAKRCIHIEDRLRTVLLQAF